jgi:hypothetical protein
MPSPSAYAPSASASVSVKSSELPEPLQARLNAAIKRALEGCVCHNDAAAEVKGFMDDVAGPEWACVVGRSFGAYFSHEPGTFHHAVASSSGCAGSGGSSGCAGSGGSGCPPGGGGSTTSVLAWKCP